MNFEKIEDKVLYILKTNEPTREDDFLLICEVYKLDHKNVTKVNFEEVMKNHDNWNLPSFHTITRCRRKIFEKYPELNPKRIKELREEAKGEYIEYSRGK